MKKILLISMAIAITYNVNAQSKKIAKIPNKLALQSTIAKRNVGIANDEATPGTLQTNPYTSTKTLVGTPIGDTWYDLQTNKCIQNRIVKHPDGTISAAWTMSLATGAPYADRGTGYNYYDGTAWQPKPTTRIEGAKTGWPSITVANGKEIIISHTGAGLSMSQRTKGTGTWTSSTIAHSATHNLIWPRAMGVGLTSQKIHLIATDYTNTKANGVLYSRSLDGGTTWDIQDIILPGTDTATELKPTGGDSYCMNVKGDTIGVVIGDMTSDVVLIKSFDGGTTWAKQIVYQHPIPLWIISTTGVASGTSDANADGISDTLTVTDGRHALTIDNNGVFHVFMGITKIKRDLNDAADSFGYWNYVDGIIYWNSTQSTIVPQIYFSADTLLKKVGYMVDVNGNDTLDFNKTVGDTLPFGYYPFSSISLMPSAAIANDGSVICTYSSLVERTDFGDTRGYRNIYMVRSADNGVTWSSPVNVTPDDFSECVFGSLAKADDYFYLVYQRQNEPGNSLLNASAPNPQHAVQKNEIMFLKQLLVTGVEQTKNNNFCVTQNYPNPFSSSTTITVNLNKTSELSLEITNILGQKVYEKNAGPCNGVHKFTIDANNLQSGIYFYTVKADENTITKKMIVE